MPADDDIIALLRALRDAGGALRTVADTPFEGIAPSTIELARALGVADYRPAGAWSAEDELSLTRRGRRALGERLRLTMWERVSLSVRRYGGLDPDAVAAAPGRPPRWTPPPLSP